MSFLLLAILVLVMLFIFNKKRIFNRDIGPYPIEKNKQGKIDRIMAHRENKNPEGKMRYRE